MRTGQFEINALKIHQWLKDWNEVQFDNQGQNENREKPLPYFFLFSIKAGLLKSLSKVYPRQANEKRTIEIGIQRKHDPDRSKEIHRFIETGYPLSEITNINKQSDLYSDLKMPGWLPTAIVANILKEGTTRGNYKIKKEDIVKIEEGESISKIILPKSVYNSSWNPVVPPIEIIDGQHRLWAFNKNEAIADEFELPVVAFYNLDITWQAYLFYTINVKPKKINRSLAYDLYPLLRVQEWLEKAPDTAFVYKETRAQEIVEVLWSYEESPWKNRINMLGDTKSSANITQASFIRNLISSLIKTTTTKNLGGLFGAKLNDEYKIPLSWNRTQQAAFLIYVWQNIYESISKCTEPWAEDLRKTEVSRQPRLFDEELPNLDLAFSSKYSLITSDQGVRGFLHIINDMIYTQSYSLDIRNLNWSNQSETLNADRIDHKDVKQAIKDLKKSHLEKYVTKLCKELVKFDWRTSSEPHLTPEKKREQMVFKGSSGYKELRSQLLQLLIKSNDNDIKDTANKIWRELGYAK